MFKNSWPLVMFAVTLAASTARAHEIVGNRFFPATLAIDDPGVTDEPALPTVSMSKTGDNPSFKQLDISAKYAKRKTYQVAVEAVIPVNRQSGTSVGIIGQLHFYLDDIFPKTLGRPIFANNINIGRPLFGR